MKICDICGKSCYSFITYKMCRHIVCSRHEYPESCPVCAAQLERALDGATWESLGAGFIEVEPDHSEGK